MPAIRATHSLIQASRTLGTRDRRSSASRSDTKLGDQCRFGISGSVTDARVPWRACTRRRGAKAAVLRGRFGTGAFGAPHAPLVTRTRTAAENGTRDLQAPTPSSEHAARGHPDRRPRSAWSSRNDRSPDTPAVRISRGLTLFTHRCAPARQRTTRGEARQSASGPYKRRPP